MTTTPPSVGVSRQVLWCLRFRQFPLSFLLDLLPISVDEIFSSLLRDRSEFPVCRVGVGQDELLDLSIRSCEQNFVVLSDVLPQGTEGHVFRDPEIESGSNAVLVSG